MAKPPRASGSGRALNCAAQNPENDNPTGAKTTRQWRGVFLAVLAETSNVTAAAEAAGVHPSRPYKVKRLEPEFARAWHAALLEGYDSLEIDVLHRLRFGEPRDTDRKFDNATALRLLIQHRETVARERAMRENEDVGSVRASLEAKLASLRRQVMQRKVQGGQNDG